MTLAANVVLLRKVILPVRKINWAYIMTNSSIVATIVETVQKDLGFLHLRNGFID